MQTIIQGRCTPGGLQGINRDHFRHITEDQPTEYNMECLSSAHYFVITKTTPTEFDYMRARSLLTAWENHDYGHIQFQVRRL